MEDMVDQSLFERLEEAYKGKKVFLTGHTGFKGAWMLRTLSLLGAEVKGYALAPKTENDLFYYTHSINRIKKWHTLISPFLQNDTGEDMKIKDEPATWADHDEYRLLTTTNNYFIIRAQHLPN